jgi:hypothetical protein
MATFPFDCQLGKAPTRRGFGSTVLDDRDGLLAKWGAAVRTGILYEATARLRRRWRGTCIEVGEEPLDSADNINNSKGSEIIVRGDKTEAAPGCAGVLHFAPQRHAYPNGAGILNLHRNGGLAKTADRSRHLLDLGDQDRDKDPGRPARSAPGGPEQPTPKTHVGRRGSRLPAGYPSTYAGLERKVSFAPRAVKGSGLVSKYQRKSRPIGGREFPIPCSFHISACAWRGKRPVERTSSNLSRAPERQMSGRAAKEL